MAYRNSIFFFLFACFYYYLLYKLTRLLDKSDWFFSAFDRYKSIGYYVDTVRQIAFLEVNPNSNNVAVFLMAGPYVHMH